MKNKDFPVKLINKSCYLVKMEYKSGTGNKGPWEGLFVSFVDRVGSESAKYLNEAFFNVHKENYEDKEKYLAAKIRVVKSIEHLASTYLTSKEMIETFFPTELPPERVLGESQNPAGKNVSSNKFKQVCERLIKLFKEKKFEKIPVDLKTVSWNGKVKLGSPNFIRRSGDSSKQFKYYESEINK